jgi:hypothetical protein
MRRQALLGTFAAIALLLSAGCSEDKTADPAGGGTTHAAKADCPDCDPAGPNAFVQTGVGSGFYAVGSHWQVAWRFNHEPTAEMRDVFLGEDRATSEVFLFDYTVTHLDKDVFDNVLRLLATIEVVQATPAGAHADLFSPERLDQHEHKVRFVLNDLLDPVRETVYSRDYPNGKDVEFDGKSSLKTGGSVFPRTIPRVLVSGQVDAPAPSLPADLADVVDAMDPAWASRTYGKTTFDNDDVVYWAKGQGHYWPFFVQTSEGVGVLVSYEQ